MKGNCLLLEVTATCLGLVNSRQPKNPNTHLEGSPKISPISPGAPRVVTFTLQIVQLTTCYGTTGAEAWKMIPAAAVAWVCSFDTSLLKAWKIPRSIRWLSECVQNYVRTITAEYNANLCNHILSKKAILLVKSIEIYWQDRTEKPNSLVIMVFSELLNIMTLKAWFLDLDNN